VDDEISLPMTLKQLSGLAAAAWILFILVSAAAIGSLMGDSVPQLSMFLGMALLPPFLLYLLLFRVLPRIVRRFKKPATQL
jgi:hypothetical protein